MERGELQIKNRIAETQEELNAGKATLAELHDKISYQSKVLNDFQTKTIEVYNKIKGQAEIAALANIKDQIDELDSERLEKKADLEKLKSDTESMQIKYVAAKTMYESYHKINDIYAKTGEINEVVVDELSPTVDINLQCFNVKQLRQLYKQNRNLIKNCLKRYEHRNCA